MRVNRSELVSVREIRRGQRVTPLLSSGKRPLPALVTVFPRYAGSITILALALLAYFHTL